MKYQDEETNISSQGQILGHARELLESLEGRFIEGDRITISHARGISDIGVSDGVAEKEYNSTETIIIKRNGGAQNARFKNGVVET